MFNKKKIFFLIFLCVITIVIWGFVFIFADENLKVVFLDVGQGDAIFIETPNKTQVLIDGGPNKGVLRQLGKVMPFYDRSIDVVLATHPDLDHIGGLPSVLDRFDVKNIVINETSSDSSLYKVFVKKITDEKSKVLYARRGKMILDEESGVYLYFLFPDRDTSGMEANTSSIVTELVYGETSFLFTGDSPKTIEKYLISSYGKNLDVDVLKLGHHGSKTSTSQEFLTYTSPEYSIISSGKNNKYGHPHREVLEMLEQFKTRKLNTANVGSITFESDGVDLILK